MSSTPRRKRFNREQRLQSAKTWIPTYTGKNLLKGYKNWFGVDFICAIKELEILGYSIDPEYKSKILEQKKREREIAEERNEKNEKNKCDVLEQDHNFYYIVGYTSGGAPYGITWEEYERDIKEKEEGEERSEEKQIDDLKVEVPF